MAGCATADALPYKIVQVFNRSVEGKLDALSQLKELSEALERHNSAVWDRLGRGIASPFPSADLWSPGGESAAAVYSEYAAEGAPSKSLLRSPPQVRLPTGGHAAAPIEAGACSTATAVLATSGAQATQPIRTSIVGAVSAAALGSAVASDPHPSSTAEGGNSTPSKCAAGCSCGHVAKIKISRLLEGIPTSVMRQEKRCLQLLKANSPCSLEALRTANLISFHDDAALCMALQCGAHSSLIQWLLANNVPTGAKDAFGRSPLFLVFVRGSHDPAVAGLVAKLVDVGADTSETDGKSRTPLHYASRLNSAAAIVLVRMCADIHAVDADGQTALHVAAQVGANALISELLEAGADVDAADDAGYSPLALAVQASLQPVSIGASSLPPIVARTLATYGANGRVLCQRDMCGKGVAFPQLSIFELLTKLSNRHPSLPSKFRTSSSGIPSKASLWLSELRTGTAENAWFRRKDALCAWLATHVEIHTV